MSALPADPFDTVAGLPLHPLVVHAAVVLVPLGAVGLVLTAFVPALRRRYGWLALVVLLVGAVAVVVSKESGEQLAHHLGEPHDHAEWADRLTLAAFATSVVGTGWYALDRWSEHRAGQARRTLDRPTGEGASTGAAAAVAPARRPVALTVLAPLTALLALVTLGLVVATGHSGATATWKGQAASWTSSKPATSSAAGTYTLAQVAAHMTRTDCWVAVKAPGEATTGVYDLTSWIAQHPGGPSPIAGLCGTDGTAAFTAKHGDDGAQGAPERTLASSRIGTLAG